MPKENRKVKIRTKILIIRHDGDFYHLNLYECFFCHFFYNYAKIETALVLETETCVQKVRISGAD